MVTHSASRRILSFEGLGWDQEEYSRAVLPAWVERKSVCSLFLWTPGFLRQDRFCLKLQAECSHPFPSCFLLKENLPAEANRRERKEIIIPAPFPPNTFSLGKKKRTPFRVKMKEAESSLQTLPINADGYPVYHTLGTPTASPVVFRIGISLVLHRPVCSSTR